MVNKLLLLLLSLLSLSLSSWTPTPESGRVASTLTRAQNHIPINSGQFAFETTCCIVVHMAIALGVSLVSLTRLV